MTPTYYETTKRVRPVFVINDATLFPGQIAHFDLREPGLREALDWVEREHADVLVITRHSAFFGDEGPVKAEQLFSMGTIAAVRQSFQLPNGQYKILVEGLHRGKLNTLVRQKPFLEGEVTEYRYIPERVPSSDNLSLLMRLNGRAAFQLLRQQEALPDFFLYQMTHSDEPGQLSDEIAAQLDLRQEESEALLAELDVENRLALLKQQLSLLGRLAALDQALNEQATERMNHSQKEYLLREQMQILRDELGEDPEDPDSVEADYRERIQALEMPDASKEAVLKEVDRLSYLPPSSPEVSVARSYLDTILDLPWGKYTKDQKNLERSRDILDRRHYGLQEIKDRVLDFIAVRQLRPDSHGSILCLVGPPGVGKTSIARSIAEALQREFVSVRLGGMSDESEIRGHRKTYVGSMPGRIIAHMTKCQSMNPVFLLDEIDKIGNDYRGDPASALLEVLDPEQNREFVDRYLEIPFDLSQVMFVTTANTLDTIPSALLDRMEVLRISGYTAQEKFEIARKYLVPKQREEAGLTGTQLPISSAVLKEIIAHYTRESGVRELERQIGRLCRRAARRVVSGIATTSLRVGQLPEYLDDPKYPDDVLVPHPQIGVVNGLAWTEVGGEILQIEANVMKGHGSVQLTGSLGDVMKESALAGISYVRANAARYGIEENFQEQYDIHIHLPEGAVPKDGPSAGIAMATALVSALTHRPVRNDIAMTGEMTLTGRVLPIGGVVEKVLAANRYHMKQVLLPRENQREITKLPKEVLASLECITVDSLDDVLERMLLAPQEEKKPILFESEVKSAPMGFQLSGARKRRRTERGTHDRA